MAIVSSRAGSDVRAGATWGAVVSLQSLSGGLVASCVGMYGLTSHTAHRDKQNSFGAFTSPPPRLNGTFLRSIKMGKGLGGEIVAHTTIYNATIYILTSYN